VNGGGLWTIDGTNGRLCGWRVLILRICWRWDELVVSSDKFWIMSIWWWWAPIAFIWWWWRAQQEPIWWVGWSNCINLLRSWVGLI